MKQTLAQSMGRSTALVLVLGLAACQSRVQHGLPEREANRIVAALQQAGLEATKVKEKGRGGQFAVEVPRGQVTRAIQLLLKHELPRRRQAGFGEVYGKASLVPTATEQHARYLHALSGELTRTLEAISGVLEARVHLVLPQKNPLALKPSAEKPRAAVFLRVQPSAKPISEAEVRRLVAGGIQNLSADQVAVVIRPHQPLKVTPGAAALAQVGPVSVTQDSKQLLQVILGIGLVVILLLSAIVALLVIRLSRSRRALDTLQTDLASDPGTGTLKSAPLSKPRD